ncbi:protein THEMIS2 [Osmerus eperlanus]|uniref:protein THEMIS2 n=1 Tax=Osmerus eperlanus TaxID=29151 RepID=UPI002E0D7D19
MATVGASASLQEFIASLDETCLPRILQVCSGVYFQGSVYELSGSEVCLSTGDIVKIIRIHLLAVHCEDISTKEKFELPLTHTGLFKLVPEEMPYNTVEEMVSLRPEGLNSCLPFTFTSRCELTFENFTLGAGRRVTILSMEEREGQETHVRSLVQGQQGSTAEVLVPLTCRGEFYECDSDQCYTLQEIMSSPHLCSRRFRFCKTTMCGGPLVLSPIYQVHAIMHLRKDIVKFPSTLEVDVMDVTEQSQSLTFVSPFTLSEVHSQPEDTFPTMAEILEGPETQPLFLCSWLPELRKGSHLVLHRRGTSPMVLATSLKGRRAQQFFLVSQNYGGRLRRRPREFSSVYELYIALTHTPSLLVSVTRHCEEVEEEGIPALSVGEQLAVLRVAKVKLACKDQMKTVEALICKRSTEMDEDEDEEDEIEEVSLPLYMQGHFVEKITDNKKNKLADLCQSKALPLDVKVVNRDAGMETDPLMGFPSLRLEEATLEPTIEASLPGSPGQTFEIPIRWLNMSLSFTSDPLPWPSGEPPTCHLETVKEVTDSFYYEFRRLTTSDEPPPPRPPKRIPVLDSKPSKKKGKSRSGEKASSATKDMGKLSLDSDKQKRPPAHPLPDKLSESPPRLNPRKPLKAATTGKAKPNTYVKVDKQKKNVDVFADIDSDHDYESMEEYAHEVKKAQGSVMFL